MPLLGLQDTSKADIDALFDAWDTDHTGTISFQELKKILSSSTAAAAQRERQSPVPAPAATDDRT